MIFLPRPSPITVATTVAPGTTGAPTCVSPSCETSNTRSSVTVAPGSAGSNSTSTMSPGLTRYCFPPVSTTAYIAVFRSYALLASLYYSDDTQRSAYLDGQRTLARHIIPRLSAFCLALAPPSVIDTGSPRTPSQTRHSLTILPLPRSSRQASLLAGSSKYILSLPCVLFDLYGIILAFLASDDGRRAAKPLSGERIPAGRSNIMSRFEHYSFEARHALAQAREIAVRLQHKTICTEHLLCGLLDVSDSTAAALIVSLGVSVVRVRQALEFVI